MQKRKEKLRKIKLEINHTYNNIKLCGKYVHPLLQTHAASTQITLQLQQHFGHTLQYSISPEFSLLTPVRFQTIRILTYMQQIKVVGSTIRQKEH